MRPGEGAETRAAEARGELCAVVLGEGSVAKGRPVLQKDPSLPGELPGPFARSAGEEAGVGVWRDHPCQGLVRHASTRDACLGPLVTVWPR